ncbi:hypothetical protein HYE10_03035 [Mycoplasmopsis bovis]|nr:hypothetical protein HYE10_03035 [Mycoplasmopsis bovis]
MNWHRKNTRRSKIDGYYVYETNRTDLSEKKLLIYIQNNDKLSNFKTLKGNYLRPRLSTWNHMLVTCYVSFH